MLSRDPTARERSAWPRHFNMADPFCSTLPTCSAC